MNESFEKRLEVELAKAKTNRAARKAENDGVKEREARRSAARRELDNANQARIEDYACAELHYLAKTLASSLGLGCEVDDSSKPESLSVVFTGETLGSARSSSFKFAIRAVNGKVDSEVTCRLPEGGNFSSFANFWEHRSFEKYNSKELTFWFQEQSVAVAKFYLDNAPIA